MALPKYNRPPERQPVNSFDYDMYLKYLESEKWNELRNKRLLIDNYLCAICGNPYNLQVHHLLYPRILGTEHITHLVTLCSSCHSAIENRKKSASYTSRTQIWYSDLTIWINFANESEFKHDGKKLREYIEKTSANRHNRALAYFTETKSASTISNGEDLVYLNLEDCKPLMQLGFDITLNKHKED